MIARRALHAGACFMLGGIFTVAGLTGLRAWDALIVLALAGATFVYVAKEIEYD